MKPIFTVTLQCESFHDGIIEPIGLVEVDQLGHLTITLQRDELGGIKLKSEEVKPDSSFLDALSELALTLKEYHHKQTEANILSQHVQTDIWQLHKLLNR